MVLSGENGQKYTTNIYNLEYIKLINEYLFYSVYNDFVNWVEEIIAEHSFEKESNIIRFEHKDISLDVNISPNENTVWLTQNQIAELFETTQQNISFHLNSIYESGELEKWVTHKKYLLVQIETEQIMNLILKDIENYQK